MLGKLLNSHTVIFLLGMFSVGLARTLSSALATVARPVAKEAIKGGISLSREVQEIVDQVKEDLEDIAAEAVTEISQSEGAKAGAGKG